MLFRLCLAFFLLIPSPVFAEEVPGEVTVNEGFEDSTYETGLTVSTGVIYCDEQDRYGTTGCSLGIGSSTLFEFSENVYEVGFIVGAVNNSYTVKYYYSDNTDETIQKSGQDNSEGPPWANMYDSFYKSFTDYNNDEANTDKFITKFEVNVSDPTVVDTLYWQYVDESTIPTTTTSTTTTTTTSSTTTTTTTTTTVPPPPPPPTTTTTTLPPVVIVTMDDGSEAEYEVYEIEDGTVERDNERKANEDKYDCYMTDAQIERGDCDIPEEESEEEVIIIVDEEEYDTKEELSDDDDMVLELELEDEVEELEPIKEEEPVEEEVEIDVEILEEEFDFEEVVIEIPDEVIIIIEEEIIEEELVEDELDKEIPGDDIIREDAIQEEDVKDQDIQEEVKEPEELTEEEVAVEVAEIEQVVEVPIVEEDATEEEVAEAIEEYVEELETEEVIEVLEEVNDVGVQNLEEVSEEVQEVIQAVVEEAIEDVEELTEEQVEVVAEVLQVETEDVEIIAEAVKEDEVVAEAVEEYVERAVENADVENYTLADVVTEVQYEAFLENPIEILVDFDNLGDITIANIGDDMTTDQKEKAQEVVVPVILTRIASMAAFIFRRS